MLEGKALIEDTDMPLKMQIQAMAAASQALDVYDVFDCRSIAAHIKKVTSLCLNYLSLYISIDFFTLILNMSLFFLFMRRSLIRDMDLDGNVWWGQTSAVSSLIPKGLSSISLWRLSTFSSSKGLLLLLHDPRESKDIQGDNLYPFLFFFYAILW